MAMCWYTWIWPRCVHLSMMSNKNWVLIMFSLANWTFINYQIISTNCWWGFTTTRWGKRKHYLHFLLFFSHDLYLWNATLLGKKPIHITSILCKNEYKIELTTESLSRSSSYCLLHHMQKYVTTFKYIFKIEDIFPNQRLKISQFSARTTDAVLK